MNRCRIFGHSWALTAPALLTLLRFWNCSTCQATAGLQRQHAGTPSRWLFTFWRGKDASILKVLGY